jgi:hypothetical protein
MQPPEAPRHFPRASRQHFFIIAGIRSRGNSHVGIAPEKFTGDSNGLSFAEKFPGDSNRLSFAGTSSRGTQIV